MKQPVRVSFHNLGWRSWIECSLCALCPKSDGKGCCSYSPLFMPVDLGYFQLHNPELIKEIFRLQPLTVLDSCVIVDSCRDADGSLRCQFHSRQSGCTLIPELREFICRKYVCSGMRLWEQAGVERWKEFFEELENREALLNKAIETELRAGGAWLNKDRERFFGVLGLAYAKHFQPAGEWARDLPEVESFLFEVDVTDWNEWKK